VKPYRLCVIKGLPEGSANIKKYTPLRKKMINYKDEWDKNMFIDFG